MPSLKKMLEREAKSIVKNDVVGKRNDCESVLISAKYRDDGHIHHILPDKETTSQLVEDLMSYVSLDTIKGDVVDKEPPKEIVFRNRQAIGDILTMTCLVRDFKTKFPNTRVGVQTTAMHIWDNNPHIDHTFVIPPTDERVLAVGPGFLTNKSNARNEHMCNAFRFDVQNKTGLEIPQGPIRPDVWLTQEEYSRKPLIDGPYWIFIYGGEPGWPSKQYHRWQEVINLLKDDIQFVQLGVSKHNYPALDNCINYIGKTEDKDTGIRDLFNIFLHAQGSLGLVSMHMHLSAAFGIPCVVLAGGREPSWFTQYYGHQVIQTNGVLPCVERTACWACKLEGCKNLVESEEKDGQRFTQYGPLTKNHHTVKVPKCVDIISPEEIAEGVRKYYKGGVLEYGKKKPNVFFKNVVRERKVFTVPKVEKVDDEHIKKFGFEWGGGSITDRDWMFLKDVFKKYNIKTVLEFGAGLSTCLFGTIAEKVVTFETLPGWIKDISLKTNPEINHILTWDGKKLDIDLEDKELRFDFAFVDGPAGGANREFSTFYGSKLADIVVVHDAGREWERKWQDKYLKEEFDGPGKGGHRCHLWVKKNIAAKKAIEKKEEIRVKIENDDRPSFRMITTCRGYGGSEKSSLYIMKMMSERGYRVELIPTGNISGAYKNDIPTDVIIRPWSDMVEPVDILTFYTSDTIWNFDKQPQYELMDKLNVKRKVMILNYQLGGAGQVAWTKDWDLYMFLNSTKEGELLKRLPNVKTQILPPPTDLTKFFDINVSYTSPLKLIRHNSQRDAKHADYTNDLIRQIWDEVGEEIEFYYMPPRSNCFEDDRIHKYKVNEIPVPTFLSLGNCFWYLLPPDYQDQGPRVILEAMACGLPCIGDNRYGAKDRITPETGWLIDDISEVFDILKEIKDDMSILEKKGKAAKERAKKHFVAENWIKSIIGKENVENG